MTILEYEETPTTPQNLSSFQNTHSTSSHPTLNYPSNQTSNDIFVNEKTSSISSVSAMCKVQPCALKQPTIILSARELMVPVTVPPVTLMRKHSTQAKLVFKPASNKEHRPSSMTVDDTKIDYTSLLGTEERKMRFSEDMVDMDLKDSIKLQKMYKQIQRQIRCNQDSKEQQLTE